MIQGLTLIRCTVADNPSCSIAIKTSAAATAAKARDRKMRVAAKTLKMKIVTTFRSLKMMRVTKVRSLKMRSHQSDDPGVQRGQKTATTGRLRLVEPDQTRKDRRCPVYSLAGQRGQQTTPATGRLHLGKPDQPRTREDRRCPVYSLAGQIGQQTAPATGRPRLCKPGRQLRDDCRRLLYKPSAQREQQTSRITHPTTTRRPRLQGCRSDAHSQS
uniref:Uncharacterized protein n=1 Tax=Branchiostoma floridae TaxID=7739 RepID=C3YXZ6_BRAFL|eukprot:XP_002598943.1 hypothetical protein BRAFLDRAFT_79873 [Branchiostoma floridae]